MKLFDFENKVALITGGSSGIGRATAQLLGSLGARVFILSRTEEDAKAVALELSAVHGGVYTGLAGDVTAYDQMRNLFELILGETGRIDTLVNCAGINVPKGIVQTTIAEWEQVISVNLTGVFICCKLGAETMISQKSGSIVNVSSVQSRTGGRSVQYSASKAGVEGLTRSLARQLAEFNVRVNAVAPGGTNTRFAAKHWNVATRERIIQDTMLHRIAEPEEIARVIGFIASDNSSYITGSTIHVNGGAFPN